MNLSSFQKPSRYINSEINSLKKNLSGNSPFEVVRVALSFPDTYEVGMSHLGMKILYEIINRIPHASAERVFAPWTDMEEYMRRNNIFLSSLETKNPLKNFDIAGFSLQYELSYTTVLNMLNLGGIPLHSEERLHSKDKLPLVIAGGPCTVNPAPMAAFIDAFLIGDGEEAVAEMVKVVKQWKREGDGKRESILKEIAELEGFYVPLIHSPSKKIKRRFVEDIEDSIYPVKPIVPYTAIVHDRINIEVSRGCTRGCRFCQAGMIYRPLRERSPERALEIAGESLKNTGYEEVSFTSLSAGDYTHLLPLVKEFNRRFGESKIALSLPSLRVAAINRDVLKEIRSIRKTGFTLAPEAATERLRNVINKDFNDEDYERAIKSLFEEGWLNLKLYFMIGLPTERDEDIEAIKGMAMRALSIAKRNTGRFVNISITVSPFVPKAHTPFQWCGQISHGEMIRKLRYLREALGAKKIKYKGHDNKTSLLEAVFARGDERLSALIHEAWQQGCRLDGWSEVFDFNKWLKAMDKTGIDCSGYAEKVFGKDETLPWDNIDIGIKKGFLLKEYERAVAGEKTPDCKIVCTACGLKCIKGSNEGQVTSNLKDSNKLSATGNELKENNNTKDSLLVTRYSLLNEDPPLVTRRSSLRRVRVQFSKRGELRCLSHLELQSAILRGMRRAKVPFDFTKGFHPSPKVSFGPSLGVGTAGEREYFDMEVFTPFDLEFYKEELNKTLPEGIGINRMAIIPVNEPSLSSFIKRYEYEIRQNTEYRTQNKDKKSLGSGLCALGSPLIVQRDGREVDISPCIESIIVVKEESLSMNSFRLMLKDSDAVKVRVGEIAEALFGVSASELEITRTALYGQKGTANEWVEPL